MTKEADYLLCVLYREYKSRRADGKSRSDSSDFGSSQNVFNNFFAEWDLEDIDDTLRELHRLGYVKCLFADDTVYNFSMTTEGIASMEQRFANKMTNLLDTIVKLKSLIC